MPEETDLETLDLGVKSAKLASFVAITQFLALVVSGIMVVVVARLLGPSDYGIYTLAYSVSALFGFFGAFGLAAYLHKHIPYYTAKKKRRELGEALGTSLALCVIISFAVFLVGALLSSYLSNYVFHSTDYVPLILVALFSIMFTTLMSIEYNALIGFKDGMGSALTYASGNISIVAISIALVYLGYGPLGAIVGLLLGSFVGVIVGLIFILKHSKIIIRFKGFGERVKHMLIFSLPIAGTNLIVGVLSNFSILFLGVYSTSIILGYYGVAYRIGTIISTVIGFVGGVLIQMFASAMESKKSARRMGDLYNYSIYFGVLVSAPIAILIIALPHAFATSIFPGYKGLYYTPTLIVGVLIGIISAYAMALAISFGRVGKVLKYGIITALFQLVLILVLVPMINAYGVILALYYVGNLISDYLYIRFLRRELGIQTRFGKVFRVVAATIVLGIVLLPINLLSVSETAQLAFGIVVTLAVYPLVLGLAGALGSKEIKILRELSARTPFVGWLLESLLSYASIFAK